MGVCHSFGGSKRPIQNGVNTVFTSFFDKLTHTFEIISLLLTNCYYIQITPIYIIILVARLFVCMFVRELLRLLLADLLHFGGKCSGNTRVPADLLFMKIH